MLLRLMAGSGLKFVALLAIVGSVAPMPAFQSPLPVEAAPFQPLADGPRILVPSSIDSTGKTDASARLKAFLARVPDRSTIVFKAGGTYRLDEAIRIDRRQRLVFDGQGAILRIAGCRINDSAFVVDHLASNITIRKFIIVGDNAAGGTSDAYEPGCEYQTGVAIYSGRNVQIANVTITRTRGDCVYVSAAGSAYTWSDRVWFHHSTCKLNGRMGVAITAASNVTVERVHFNKVAMTVLDVEPNTVEGGGTHVTFRNNTVAIYGLSSRYTGWFVAAQGEPGSTVSDLTVTGNEVLAGAPPGPNTVTLAGLATTIRVERRQRVVFRNNSTTVAGSGPALYFSHVDGLTVTGNVQPLTKGHLARFVDCSAVTYD
jgi:hypothetical protein